MPTPPPNQSGKTFVVGGSGGLGQAICRRMAADGAFVVLTYRQRKDAAEQLVSSIHASGGRARAVQADLESAESVERAFAAACEGSTPASVIYASGPDIPQEFVSKIGSAQWNAHVIAELNGFFTLVHRVLPALRERGGGSIVATSSFATSRAVAGDVLSAVPKAGIEMLVRQIAKEEGRYNIRANCVAPGIIDAGLGAKAQASHYTPEVWDAQRKNVPLRRFGTAEDVAQAVCFLASPQSAYITGQILTVDGGLSV